MRYNMKLFDEKFIHCIWNDELKGKEVFYADEINDLIEKVTNEEDFDGRKVLYNKSCNHRYPFQIDKRNVEDCYRFVYYDPNYDIKIAFLNGETIQYRELSKNNSEWKDIYSLSNISYFDNSVLEYRIKPEENQKWWVMPKYDCFSSEAQQFGQSYVVEKQEDIYSKSRPPLKSNFESKEEAEKWLKKYLENERLYTNAIDDIENLVCNLGYVVDKLRKHEDMTEKDWDSCFALFNSSRIEGSLKQVTK